MRDVNVGRTLSTRFCGAWYNRRNGYAGILNMGKMTVGRFAAFIICFTLAAAAYDQTVKPKDRTRVKSHPNSRA